MASPGSPGRRHAMSDASSDPLQRVLLLDFQSKFRKSYARFGPQSVVMPQKYGIFAAAVEAMPVREDDVWVVSHLKTGTTWTQEMVWCIANQLDFEAAKVPLSERFPCLEISAIIYNTDIFLKMPDLKLPGNILDSVQHISDLPSPRFIKSHLPLSLLPAQIREKECRPKIIYVARNPKDTCVSYYHHCKLFKEYQGDFEDFCKLFLGDMMCYFPYWSHVLEFWERRSEPNILFLKYEDMKKDQEGAIRKTAAFLEKTISEEDVKVLAEHLSFDKMKKNPAVNLEPLIAKKNGPEFLSKTDLRFIRKGQVGDWKNHMSDALAARFDSWTEEHLRDTGLSFD